MSDYQKYEIANQLMTDDWCGSDDADEIAGLNEEEEE